MTSKLFGFVALFIGIGILLLGINYFKDTIVKQNTYTETTAYIVDYEGCELENGSGIRYIAEYEVDKRKYRVAENGCSNIPKNNKKEVKVKYNPENPEDAVFSGDISHYLIPAISIVFIIGGITMICRRKPL